MDPITITTAAIELIKLGVNAYEASQAGNEDEAMAYLRQAQDRVKAADDAWQDAAKSGDDEG